MLKKSLIVIGVLAVVMVAVMFYLRNRGRTLSPPGKAEITSGILTVKVSYNRPSVRGRVIFGTEESGAIQPYGVYWRLGANESTEISIDRDVLFNGVALKKGTYKIYVIPGPEKFEVRLNQELGTWGAWEPDYAKDILTTTTTVEKLASPVEQFTIRFEPAESGTNLIFEFSDVRCSIPILAADNPTP